ncbi:MAG: site-specific integrase [Coriobacteriia bacterium]|nr:site-specific integrase [Coriobacteriia bacterium]
MSREVSRARRPKGAGSLRRLDGEKWQLTIKVDGRRYSRVFTARNATEAHHMSAAVRTQIDAAVEAASSQRGTQEALRNERREWTLERYIAYYFEEWADHALAPTTRQHYKLLAKNRVIPRLGSKKIREITPADLGRLYAALEKPDARCHPNGKTGLSNLSIWHVHTFIEAVYSFANRTEDLDYNPARRVRPGVSRTVVKRQPALDMTDIERLLKAVREQEPALYPPVMVSAYLGTRRGELCGLRWSDVDFDKGEVTIRRSVTRTKPEGLLVKCTKTGKERTIPIDEEALAEFDALRKAQRRERLNCGPGWAGAESAEDDYVCTSPDGSVLNPDHFSAQYRAFTHAHGFTQITPHALRHAFVSQLIALGFDAVTIASMSGHSPDVLLKTYAHAFDKRKRAAMEALGEARKAARVAG